MSFHAWLAYVAVLIVVCVIPGPAVLFCVSQALSRGPGAGLRAIAGIEAGNLIFFAIAAAGVGAFVAASGAALVVIKFAGASYLFVLGVRVILHRSDGPVEDLPRPRGGGSFGKALLTQLSNPKSILFYSALLPQFFSNDASLPLGTILILVVTGFAVEVPILLSYIGLASRGARIPLRAPEWTRRWGPGLALMGVGTMMAFEK